MYPKSQAGYGSEHSCDISMNNVMMWHLATHQQICIQEDLWSGMGVKGIYSSYRENEPILLLEFKEVNK